MQGATGLIEREKAGRKEFSSPGNLMSFFQITVTIADNEHTSRAYGFHRLHNEFFLLFGNEVMQYIREDYRIPRTQMHLTDIGLYKIQIGISGKTVVGHRYFF